MGPLEHAVAIGAALDALEIPWVLGGSMAGSLVGEPRSTNDIDVAVRLSLDQVSALVEAMDGFYLAPLGPLQEAARHHSSFNLIHLDTGFKVDLFFLGDSLLDRWQIARRERIELPHLSASIWVTSPADLVLRKLWWFRLGGGVSDRQWRDVVAILRVQHDHLDHQALASDASKVGLGDLLDGAIDDAD